MMIQEASQWPLDECCVKQVGAARGAGPLMHLAVRRKWLAVAMGILCFLWGQMAAAQAGIMAGVKRKDEQMSQTLWSPPPDGVPWVYNEAQLGSSDAPFVFSGDTLFIAESFELGRPVVMGDAQARIYTHGDSALHISGIVASDETAWPGGLVKLGSGNLFLSGPNTYRGATLLMEGGLHVAGGQALGADVDALQMNTGTLLGYAPGANVSNAINLVDMDASGWSPFGAPASDGPYDSVYQLRVDEGQARQTGNIFGEGVIVKQGAGALMLAGNSLASGGFVVNEGTLGLMGNVVGGPVQVNRGARLEGHGAVGTMSGTAITVREGAVLAPTNAAGRFLAEDEPLSTSLGALRVQGDLVFESGASLEVGVSPSGQREHIHVQVTGAALLNGQVLARADAGEWRPRTRYTLLHAEKGFSGTTFASAVSTMPFLSPTLSYDDHNVYLRLDRNDTPLDDAAETPTEKEVADVIDEQDNPDVHDKVVVMDKEQARDALSQLSGSWSASLMSSLTEDSRFVREAALQYARAHGFWGRTFYSSSDRGSQNGTHGDERTVGGLLIGFNHSSPNGYDGAWVFGGYIGSQHSELRRGRSMASARIESLHAGLIASREWPGAALKAGAAYSWHNLKSHRRIAVAGLNDRLSAHYRGGTTQLFAEASTGLTSFGRSSSPPVPPGHHMFSITPFARLAWIQTRTQPYIEDGGSAALGALSARQSVLVSIVGLKAQHDVDTDIGLARVQGAVEWSYASGNASSFTRHYFRDSANRTRFTSEGLPVARQAWAFHLGVDAFMTKASTLALAYAGRFAKKIQDHGVQVTLAWAF